MELLYYRVRTIESHQTLYCLAENEAMAYTIAQAVLSPTSNDDITAEELVENLFVHTVMRLKASKCGGSRGYVDNSVNGFSSTHALTDLLEREYVPFQTREEKINSLL